MKLRAYEKHGVILAEPDEPGEMRADEPDHDDAEAREEKQSEKPRIVFAEMNEERPGRINVILGLDSTAFERAIQDALRADYEGLIHRVKRNLGI